MDKGRASQNPYSPSHIARWSISHHPCTQPSNLPPTYWNGVPQRQAQALAAKWSRFIPAKPQLSKTFEHFRRSIWLKPLKKEMPKASPKSPRKAPHLPAPASGRQDNDVEAPEVLRSKSSNAKNPNRIYRLQTTCSPRCMQLPLDLCCKGIQAAVLLGGRGVDVGKWTLQTLC